MGVSHPTIGTVGLTEPQAREKYGDQVKICECALCSPVYFISNFTLYKRQILLQGFVLLHDT